MGERKVLNKYYPPDFDPAALPKMKRAKTNDMKVRMMLPMSVRCKTCGTFMYKGTKFNTRKEDVLGENYLGIQIYRFYYRCTNCAAEFTMKTDPKTTDYILEEGASRNYEPWREQEKAVADAKKERDEEEMGNAMKALENRTLDSKREMDILAALDEMRSLKAKQNKVTTEEALAALQRAAYEDAPQHEEDIDLSEFYALRKKATEHRIHGSSSDEEDAPGPAGPSAGAQAVRRQQVVQKAGHTSLAAAAFADEDEEQQATADQSAAGSSGKHEQQQVAAAAGASTQDARGPGAEQRQQQPQARGPAGADPLAAALDAATGGSNASASGAGAGKPAPAKPAPFKPQFKVVAKPKAAPPPAPAQQPQPAGDSDEEGGGLQGLLGGYGSGSDASP